MELQIEMIYKERRKEMKRNKLSRVLACTMAVAMAASSFTAAPKASAASGKYVKSLKVKKKVSVSAGSATTVKPKVKVVKKATKKLKVKVKDTKIATAKYNAKKQSITIKGIKAGKTTVTVTTKGTNKKGKKLSAKINITVTAATVNKTNPTTAPVASTAPATPVPSNTVVTVPTQTPEPTHYAEVNLKGNVVDAYAQNGIYSVDDLESYRSVLKSRKKAMQAEKSFKKAANNDSLHARHEKVMQAEKRMKRVAADSLRKESSEDDRSDNLQDAQVYLVPNTDNQIDVDNLPDNAIKTTTDENGDYEFEKVSCGDYGLVIQKKDYKPAIQFITLNDRQPDYQMEAMYVLNETIAAAVQGQITGTIVDATNKNPIEGLTVELRHNKGNTFGAADMKTTTDADGVYSFGDGEEKLEADQYTVYVKDERKLDSEEDSHYLSNTMNTCVYTNEPASLDIAMTKPLSSSGAGLRFVLQWGSEGWDGVPRDIDSHLYGPRAVQAGTDESDMFHIYYDSKNYGIGNEVYANLDVDDVYYEGPETVTLEKEVDGIYYYYVYNYSGEESLARSQATVKVYASGESEPLTIYNVPSSNGSERWWKVCSYNSKTHKLTSYNVLEEYNSNSLEESYDDNFYLGYEKIGLPDNVITVKNEEDLYSYDNGTSNQGISIYGYVPWAEMQAELDFNVLPGYTASFKPVADISSAHRGDLILTNGNGDTYSYPVYYYRYIEDAMDGYEIQVEGDALVKYFYDNYGYFGEIRLTIAANQKADVEKKLKTLKFTSTNDDFVCGDIKIDYISEDGSGNAYLALLDAKTGEFINEVFLYIQTAYLSSITYKGENISFEEWPSEIDLYGDTYLDLKELTYNCVNGYTAKVVQKYDEDEDYTSAYLQIKDSTGKTVVEKYLYYDYYDDYYDDDYYDDYYDDDDDY